MVTFGKENHLISPTKIHLGMQTAYCLEAKEKQIRHTRLPEGFMWRLERKKLFIAFFQGVEREGRRSRKNVFSARFNLNVGLIYKITVSCSFL